MDAGDLWSKWRPVAGALDRLLEEDGIVQAGVWRSVNCRTAAKRLELRHLSRRMREAPTTPHHFLNLGRGTARETAHRQSG